MVSSLFTLRCCVLCKQREDWTWLCAMCSVQSTESKHGENHLLDWHPCSIPCTSVIRISGLSCSSSWHSSYRILWRTGSAQALETLGAQSEGERLPPSSKYRAKPGNLPVHAERAPIVSGEGGKMSTQWPREGEHGVVQTGEVGAAQRGFSKRKHGTRGWWEESSWG